MPVDAVDARSAGRTSSGSAVRTAPTTATAACRRTTPTITTGPRRRDTGAVAPGAPGSSTASTAWRVRRAAIARPPSPLHARSPSSPRGPWPAAMLTANQAAPARAALRRRRAGARAPAAMDEGRRREQHGQRKQAGHLRSEQKRDCETREGELARRAPEDEEHAQGRARPPRGRSSASRPAGGRRAASRRGARRTPPSAVEADPPRDSVDRQHRGEEREELHEPDPASRSGEEHRRSLEDLRVRGELVDARVGGVPIGPIACWIHSTARVRW